MIYVYIYIHITQRFRGDNKCLDPFFRSPSYHEFSIRCQLGVPSPSIQPVTGQREMSHGRARHTAPEVQPVLIRIFPGSDQQDVDFTWVKQKHTKWCWRLVTSGWLTSGWERLVMEIMVDDGKIVRFNGIYRSFHIVNLCINPVSL